MPTLSQIESYLDSQEGFYLHRHKPGTRTIPGRHSIVPKWIDFSQEDLKIVLDVSHGQRKRATLLDRNGIYNIVHSGQGNGETGSYCKAIKWPWSVESEFSSPSDRSWSRHIKSVLVFVLIVVALVWAGMLWTENSNLRAQLVTVKGKLENAKQHIASLSRELEITKTELDSAKQHATQWESRASAAETKVSEIESTKTELDSVRQQATQWESRASEAETKVLDLNKELEITKTELDSIKNLSIYEIFERQYKTAEQVENDFQILHKQWIDKYETRLEELKGDEAVMDK